MLETFNAITRRNWPENFAMKCHDAIYSDFCLENRTQSFQIHCSQDQGKLSTEQTTTTTQDTVSSKVIMENSDTTILNEEDFQSNPTTQSQTLDISSLATENDVIMSTLFVTIKEELDLSTLLVTIKEELDLTFNSTKLDEVTPSVPLIINQNQTVAASRESTQIPAGDDTFPNNTDQIPAVTGNGLNSSGAPSPVNSNIRYVPKLNEPTLSEAEIFLILGATISLCVFLLCCLCIFCLRKW